MEPITPTRSQHASLLTLCCELLAANARGDWAKLAQTWCRFETTLRAHLAAEEDELFPIFTAADRATAIQLFADHRRLRRGADSLHDAIEAHEFPGAAIEALVTRLRVHQLREEKMLDALESETLESPALSG